MAYTKNANGTYTDLPLTGFPANVDSWEDNTDVSSDLLTAANNYKTLLAAGDYTNAQAVLTANPELSKAKISALAFNQLKQAIMAIERMWSEDIETYIKNQGFGESLMISTYTHTYDSTAKVHTLTGDGSNGRMIVTAAFTSGDTFKINTTTATVYGAFVLVSGCVGKYVSFFVKDNEIYFIPNFAEIDELAGGIADAKSGVTAALHNAAAAQISADNAQNTANNALTAANSANTNCAKTADLTSGAITVKRADTVDGFHISYDSSTSTLNITTA